MHVGKAIKTRLLQIDKTQVWLAQELGFTKTWVSAITSGLSTPSLKTLKKICDKTDTKMSDLFKLAEDFDS